MDELCDSNTRKKCTSFYKEAFLNRKDYIEQLEKQLTDKDKVIDELTTNWNELENYIENNKMILNNPNIFQFYLIQIEILNKVKGDNK